MSKKSNEKSSKKMPLRTILIAVAIGAAAGFGAVYVNMGDDSNVAQTAITQSGKPGAPAKTGLAAYAKGAMTTFVARTKPQKLPEFTFVRDDGSETSLAEWRGKVVLLNLWATWCGPCRKEMPDLDRLKAELAGDDFDLVALSIDRTGLDKPRKFLEEIGIKNLKLYNNSSGKLAASLKAFGMPTTLLLNREGEEIGRLVGPAEWGSKDAVELIKAAIAENS
ncbi:MAG: TlpA family protein disulfide reductase [Hyphomicrobiaceae bacterium]|nr:TlpA family protein disulfide reductase [Hyphomicrobiaceae bacterium]